MAVAQGYGKTVTSGSVFAYDVADTVNSYVGEPTANLIPSPTINALPTTGNSWGTYNTNQYCGNNGCGAYWNLATVSSISSNIVTTATAHNLRTYDVINPETTGGGVTAGTQYFVKAISTTQFTLHAYNGSQDGSQGYINPSTGTYKVHDSIALDQRVSINSSGFPTKWFGNAHQPNSGLVKEIITNGYRHPLTGKLTDCIRQHITRADGVDHMAYGGDASITPNSPVYCSFWARAVDTAAVGKAVNFYHYTYGVTSATDYSTSVTLGAVGEWRRYGYTFTSPNSVVISYWFNPAGPFKYDIANIQIEQKNHATPFVAGTRSATQGLLPLVGNSTLDLTNVSFDSNAQMTFDGTNDYLSTTPFNPNFSAGLTLECIAKWTSSPGGSWQRMFDFGNGASVDNLLFCRYSSTDQLWFGVYNGAGTEYALSNSGAILFGQYALYTATADGTNFKIYVNGQLIYSTANSTVPVTTPRTNNYIGKSNWPDSYFNGDIPTGRVYNRGLSAGEVRQNYLHYKTRFNLS